MYIIACCMFWFFGGLLIWGARPRKRQNTDYSQYPITEAVVLGTRRLNGDRWLVRFEDEAGENVYAADDMYAYSTFFPEKYRIPKRGTTERVYYWKNDSLSWYRIKGVPIQYAFHFCNEDRYLLMKKKHKGNCVRCWLGGLALIFAGFLILFVMLRGA